MINYKIGSDEKDEILEVEIDTTQEITDWKLWQ